MPTLNQQAYAIAEALQKTDDQGYIEIIKYNIKLLRATLLRRDQARNTRQSSVFEQDLGMVYLDQVDSAEDANVIPGKIVKKSLKKIPAPVRFKTPSPFRFVGEPDKINPIDFLPENRLRYMENRAFSAGRPGYYYREGYLYLIGYEGHVVNVRGIFEDPEKVMEDFYPATDESIDEMDFPISSDMAAQISDMIINQNIKLTTIPGQDEQHIEIDK